MLLVMPTALTAYQLYRAARDSGSVSIRTRHFETTVPRQRCLAFALETESFRCSHAITAANLPGIFVEVSISLPTSWPNSWCPSGLSLEAWRALSLPFFCLPAWWFVGTGLDGLLKGRRLHWTAPVTGSVLCIFCAVLLVGLSFERAADDHGLAWVYCGLGFWTIAFGVPPLAWILQRRKGRATDDARPLAAPAPSDDNHS